MSEAPIEGMQVTGHAGIPEGTTVKKDSTVSKINLDFPVNTSNSTWLTAGLGQATAGAGAGLGAGLGAAAAAAANAREAAETAAAETAAAAEAAAAETAAAADAAGAALDSKTKAPDAEGKAADDTADGEKAADDAVDDETAAILAEGKKTKTKAKAKAKAKKKKKKESFRQVVPVTGFTAPVPATTVVRFENPPLATEVGSGSADIGATSLTLAKNMRDDAMSIKVSEGMEVIGHSGIPDGTRVTALRDVTQIDIAEGMPGTKFMGPVMQLEETVPGSAILRFSKDPLEPTLTAMFGGEPLTATLGDAPLTGRVGSAPVTARVHSGAAAKGDTSLTLATAMVTPPSEGMQVSGHRGIPDGTTVKAGSTPTKILLDFTVPAAAAAVAIAAQAVRKEKWEKREQKRKAEEEENAKRVAKAKAKRIAAFNAGDDRAKRVSAEGTGDAKADDAKAESEAKKRKEERVWKEDTIDPATSLTATIPKSTIIKFEYAPALKGDTSLTLITAASTGVPEGMLVSGHASIPPGTTVKACSTPLKGATKGRTKQGETSLIMAAALRTVPSEGVQVTGHMGIPKGTTVRAGSTATQIELDFVAPETGLTAIVRWGRQLSERRPRPPVPSACWHRVRNH